MKMEITMNMKIILIIMINIIIEITDKYNIWNKTKQILYI